MMKNQQRNRNGITPKYVLQKMVLVLTVCLFVHCGTGTDDSLSEGSFEDVLIGGSGVSTQVGSPTQPTIVTDNDDIDPRHRFDDGLTVAENLMVGTCRTIAACHRDITQEQCEESILNTSHIGDELGLVEGRYEVYRDVVDAENRGEIIADQEAMDSCIVSIRFQFCGGTVQDAVDMDNIDDPLANIHLVFPVETSRCPEIFSEPA